MSHTKRLRGLWESMVLTSSLGLNDRDNSRAQFDLALRSLEEQYDDLERKYQDAWRTKGESLLEQLEVSQDALRRIATLQDNALHYIEANGFVFDDIGKEPGNWKHLAFSLYTDLCEADTLSHAALDLPLGVRPGEAPASSPATSDHDAIETLERERGVC